ncbi:MAG: FkbM family methyltransferase [Magnetococcales bacterium]|nr:FkbM family methyltransferase [Magnetococcales bacterium]
MKLRRLPQLLRWSQRRRICGACFADPWRASLLLTFLTKNPFQLQCVHGLTHPFEWADHPLWDWLSSHQAVRVGMSDTGDLLIRQDKHPTFALRPGTSDGEMFRDIVIEDEYQLATLPERLHTVLDVGANIGLFGCLLLERADKVFLVEPDPDNVLQIKKNLALHKKKNATVLQMAVSGESNQTVDFFSHKRKKCCNTLLPGSFKPCDSDAIQVKQVKTISLRDLLQWTGENTVDLLKCDVEGAEYDIVAAAAKDGSLAKFSAILMEVHVRNKDGLAAADTLLEQIRQSGFSVQRLDSKPGIKQNKNAGKALGFNIFCRASTPAGE